MHNVSYIIGLDFESFYDKDYSLGKMPTHQYVRGDQQRFDGGEWHYFEDKWQCLGCGFQFPNEEPFYAKDTDAVEAVFQRIDALGWENVALVAHNCQFDGSVLYERFGKRKPAFWLDTQLMARYLVAQGKLPPDQSVSLAKLAPLVGMIKGDTWAAVHGSEEERADYGLDDIRIMMALLRKFLAYGFPADELEYMDMKIRGMTEPVLCLDKPLLEEAATVTPQDIELHKLLRKDANMVTLLERLGVEVEYKTTPKGKRKPALAKTDAFMQGLVASDQGLASELASRRLDANSSITHTRARTMLNVGEPLPFPALYHGAHTGRDSGSDGYNMQNMPRGSVLRRSVKAPPGHKLVVGDSGQIEARGVGWLAGDERLLDVFREADASQDDRKDAYRIFGGRYMYRREPQELDSEERGIAKAGFLGCGFGQGWRGLKAGSQRKAGLIIPDEMAQLAVRSYRQGFDRVPKWWDRLIAQVFEFGYVELPDGRRVYYPDVGEEVVDEEKGTPEPVFYRHLLFSKGPKGKRQRVRLWHGVIAENVTQASMRSVVFWQAKQMRRDGIPVLGMSHDEVISIAKEDEAQDVAERMLGWLRTPPPWAEGLPLNGEVKIADNYAEAK